MNAKIVTITGASGRIGRYIAMMLANDGLGIGRIELRLLDIPKAASSLDGMRMELEDMNSTILVDVKTFTENGPAFTDVDYAFFVGGRPQIGDEPRSALLKDNVNIVVEQAKAVKNKEAKIIVVANPANTLAYFVNKNTKANVTAMSRLDHNRAVNMMRKRYGMKAYDGSVAVMGNHSDDMIPLGVDVDMVEPIQHRAYTVRMAQGLGSSMSAAQAAVDHMHDWIHGLDWWEVVSMAIPAPADNPYGVPEGLVFSFPVNMTKQDLYIREDFHPSAADIEKNVKALQEEIAVVES